MLLNIICFPDVSNPCTAPLNPHLHYGLPRFPTESGLKSHCWWVFKVGTSVALLWALQALVIVTFPLARKACSQPHSLSPH